MDLSVTQVAASSMAAVAGAVLASELGVYGTILGAAVVSAGATVGGALFQHAFRRTGEQLRGRAGTPVPVDPARRQRADAEAVPFDPFDPGGEYTRMLAAVAPPEAGSVAVYRGRRSWRPRRWRSWALMSVLVFGLAMGTVTAVELVAGKPVAAIVRNEPGSGTSFGGTAGGRPGGGAPTTAPSGDSATPGGTPADRSPGPVSGVSPSGAPSALPSGDPSGQPGAEPSGAPSAEPSDSPSAGPGATPSGAPTPSGGPSSAP
ncbi:hypothetical protein [Streptacidiphilus sp. P02-A3a]|uniref:hypothetical protein n=1 Tax=Streptacidiphilus sp. P02-A3a TaxID=2704468 RepID=UPI0015F864A1|nr:hypothetical protein [Streptacidiphilus sp. P02-A3a]QMU72172.1 hypothetical protein GXP74_31950 [Streptacidiphilus sp. P02-A3a]